MSARVRRAPWFRDPDRYARECSAFDKTRPYAIRVETEPMLFTFNEVLARVLVSRPFQIFACDLCRGLGWTPGSATTDFAPTCRVCGGAGRLTIAEIASRIEEDPETVRNLITWNYKPRGSPRKAVARRIFEKLHALAESAQP